MVFVREDTVVMGGSILLFPRFGVQQVVDPRNHRLACTNGLTIRLVCFNLV